MNTIDPEYIRKQARMRAAKARIPGVGTPTVGYGAQPDFSQGPADLAAPNGNSLLPRGTLVSVRPPAPSANIAYPDPGQGDTVPFGQQEQADTARDLQRRRARVMYHLTSGAPLDPAAREGLIGERYALEDDLRALGRVGPTPAPLSPDAQRAGRVAIRGQLAKSLAEQDAANAAAANQPQQDSGLAAAESALPIGHPMRRTGSTPGTELSRQGILRAKANEPVLVGTPGDQEVSTPMMQEMRRRRSGALPAYGKTPEERAAEAFPDLTDAEIAASGQRAAEAGQRREAALPAAASVLRRSREATNYRQKTVENAQTLALANQEADINQANLRKTGQDTESLVARARAAQVARQINQTTPLPYDANRINGSVDRLVKRLPDLIRPSVGTSEYPETIDEELQGAADDIGAAIPDMDVQTRAKISSQLHAVLDSLTADRPNSIIGRPSYSRKWSDKIRELLNKIGG